LQGKRAHKCEIPALRISVAGLDDKVVKYNETESDDEDQMILEEAFWDHFVAR